VARGGALDAQEFGRGIVVRNADELVTPAEDHAVLGELARHLGERVAAPRDGVGLRAQRHERRTHLEDVRPAPQEVREGGPQPPDGMLANVERNQRHLAARVRGMRARGAKKTEQVCVLAGSHGNLW
jgi:hypothetical protein